MIGKLTYEQVLAFAKELRTEAEAVEVMARGREIEDLVDFTDTVEAYAKFLENKDADKAIRDLTGK